LPLKTNLAESQEDALNATKQAILFSSTQLWQTLGQEKNETMRQINVVEHREIKKKRQTKSLSNKVSIRFILSYSISFVKYRADVSKSENFFRYEKINFIFYLHNPYTVHSAYILYSVIE